MKRIAWCLPLVLVMAACVSTADREQSQALHDKYHDHCREHAREIQGEADEASRYQECMTYFIVTDINCPVCSVDPHLNKAEKQ